MADISLAGRINGETACVFGVSSGGALVDFGIPWLLGTPLIEAHAVTFLRNCRPAVDRMLSQYAELENYVDARNRVAIRWLRWLGFDIEPAAPYGPFKRPFHRFTLKRS